ncbi:pyridoxal phosphate-dependent aminotransferase [Pseudomonas sp. BN102]|uniref:pyridoxal phosphate-dependent aminotransferase n=1 Tax=Pseudomonas sp. BN102 TaxID=2567886 RepID=UPI002457F571|nr:pyridoxal phosphate-dependent aminotransferase [Pseudomonas sp. BN102]MDH4609318.1 pyridoxal phosphate-dependent aminotransferase [Pseudomonas sp. BN102]
MDRSHSMQDWVFREALGNYDIDLGDSNAPCITIEQFLPIVARTALDYGTDRGSLALRNKIAAHYGMGISSVGIAHGAQEALYLLYRTLFRPGDHVITFAPGWKQAWRVPQDIACDVSILDYNRDLKVTSNAIKQALTVNTRAIILNNPCNPTGKKIQPEELTAILDISRKRGIYLIIDEEYLVDPRESLAGRSENVIVSSGISKIHGAPGLRIGWLCGEKELIDNAMNYKHFTTISNSVLCERIALQILEEHDQRIQVYRQLCQAGFEALEQWAKNCFPMIELVPPEDTPFCWAHLTTSESSLAFCRRVLEKERVLTMPAELFGQHHGMRLTFARPLEELKEGLRRIKKQFRFPLSMY